MPNASDFNELSKFRETLSSDILKFKIQVDEISQDIIKIELGGAEFLQLITTINPPCIFYTSKTLEEYMVENSYKIEFNELKDNLFQQYLYGKKEEINKDALMRRIYQAIIEADCSIEKKERTFQLFIPYNGKFLTIGEIGENWIEELKKFDLIKHYTHDYINSKQNN